jgi:hypothetical protein
MSTSDSTSTPRSLAGLVILAACAMAAGRILAVERVWEPSIHVAKSPVSTPPPRWPDSTPRPMPTFSSNDRSRWATVRALVDDGTFAIGRRNLDLVIPTAVGCFGAPDVMHLIALIEVGYAVRVGSDRGIVFEDGWQTIDRALHPTKLEFYSTKPPLLPVMVAGEYWVVKKLFGWTLKDDPFAVVRTILLTINVLPLALYLAVLWKLACEYGRTEWARYFVLVAGAFGTLVTPFLITFNNHVPAVFTTLFALYAMLRIWTAPAESGAGWYAVAGLSAGFTMACELPAAALAAGVFLLLLRCSVSRTLTAFLPAALIPLGALAWLNWYSLGQWLPAYSELHSPWYQYEGSHWFNPARLKRGIDWASDREGKGAYALHLLVGHHGLFSLTPIFLLTLAGLFLGLGQRREPSASKESPRELPALFHAATLLLFVVVIGFYIKTTDNYGGWTTGPRWLMWLTPLGLVAMLPALDWLAGRRWGRALALLLLGFSILSASYPAWNPWRHPWIYNYLDSQGLIPY